MSELPEALSSSLAAIVGGRHVLTGAAAAGYAVDWTGRFRGRAAAVVRPRDTAEVAAVLALCTGAGVAVVPQGGNTGLVGGGVPLHGEVVLSLARLTDSGPLDRDASQVTVGAGVTLQQVCDAGQDAGLDLGIQIASRASATVGGAVATNAGGLRVLRYGPMRAQLRGIEAVLSDGTVVSHLAGLVKDNTGYDYPSLLAGSEGTLAVITKARLRLVPRMRDAVAVIIGLGSLGELHEVAQQAVRQVPGLVSAEFFTATGLDVLIEKAGLTPPLPTRAPAYLLLEAVGPGALDDLGEVIADREAAVADSEGDRPRLWSYRERHPEAAGFLGVPIKLDVSAPAAQWVRLASEVAGVVTEADPGARVITFGHVADGNVHVNIVPAADADGRHEDAVFSFVASLGGSISAEHGIGALKARWLGLARTDAELALFAAIRSALDPAGTLNPHVLPRLRAPPARRAGQVRPPGSQAARHRLTRQRALASPHSAGARHPCPGQLPPRRRRADNQPMSDDLPAVGFVGLGAMGWPMAHNLHAAGFPLVVRDVSAHAQDLFAAEHDKTVKATTQNDFRSVAILLTMLPDGGIVADAVLGWGIAAVLSPGTIIVDMSSSDPTDTLALASRVESFGIKVVDAPVSGGGS